MRRLLEAGSWLAVMVWALSVSAQEPADAELQGEEAAAAVETPAAPEAEGPAPLFTFQLGLKGGLVANLLGEPDEELINLPVPTFFGFGGAVGLALEALYLDLVGLEVDFLYVAASGTGDINFPFGISVEEELSSSELQLSLLAKLQLGYAVGEPRGPESELKVKPYLGLGVTFVFQPESEFTIDQSLLVVPVDTAIDTESYVMPTATLGMAIDAGPMRIPIELRAQFQKLDHDPRERVDFAPQTGGTLTRLAVRSTWEAQFFFLVGVQYSLGVH